MGLKNKIDNFLSSLVSNEVTYAEYYDTIKEMAITRFEWKNVPDEIDVRFLELMLFERGAVVWFYDEVAEEYVCLPFVQKKGFNIYRIPLFRQAYAVTGANWDLSEKDSVIIYNNVLRTNNVRMTEMYALRLAQFDRTIDVNINAQKTPVLIRCDEKERLSLQNLYMKYEGGQPVIYGDRNLSATPLDSINTQAPYVADKIYDLKTQYWNELLTRLGVSNISYEKRERMITDEVIRGQGGTVAERYSGLLMRQKACDEINKMFGLNISVDYREDETNNDSHETKTETELEKEVVEIE